MLCEHNNMLVKVRRAGDCVALLRDSISGLCIKPMTVIIKFNWLYLLRCSIIDLSPLYPSKEIDFSPLQ